MSSNASIYDSDEPLDSQVGENVSATVVASERGQRLPWERFYWAILDTSATPHLARNLRSAAARATLDDRFEPEIPQPLDQVATSYADGDGTTVLACGLELEQLNQELLAHPGLLSLTPDGLPPELQSRFPNFEPDQLNILIATHEPQPLRFLRSKTRRTLLAIAAAMLALATLGTLRRASDNQQQLASLSSSMNEAVAEVTGSNRDLEVSLRMLEQDRDRLASTRTMQAVRGLPLDASRALAAVLSAWPNDLEVKTQTIAASSQGVTVAAEVDDQSAAEVLSQSLASVPGWTLQSPRTHSTGRAVRFDASLQPKGATR